MNETAVTTRSKRQWEAAAKVRISKGEPGSIVEADFVKQGLDPQSAKTIIDDAVYNVRSRAIRLMIGSLAFAGLGLFVTVASYSAAMSGSTDGTYWIWYGPVIAGGIVALVALSRLLRVRR